MTSKRIIVVRHGESEGNVDSTMYLKKHNSKLELTDLGVAQAVEVGWYLKDKVGEGESAIAFSSPYLRTLGTAEWATGHLDIPIYEENLLREVEWGSYWAKRHDHDENFNLRLEQMRTDRYFYQFPHGESMAKGYDRFQTFMYGRLKNALEKHDVVVLFTHGIMMKLIDQSLRGLTNENTLKMQHPKNCETRIYTSYTMFKDYQVYGVSTFIPSVDMSED